MSKVIASLFVNLRANTTAFSTGMTNAAGKSERASARITKSFARIGPALGLAVAAAVTALAVLTKKQIDAADKLAKMSQAVGISVENLSALSFGAELSGIELDTLGARLTNLNRRAKEGARGVKTYKLAFDTLGISLKDGTGKLRGTEDLLLDVADAFSKMEDGTLKSALATDIFSNQGVQMLPFLNQGREGILAMKDEAVKFGRVISTSTALAAEQFNDNLSRLGSVVAGVGNKIAAKMLPALVAFTDNVVEFAATSPLIDGLVASFVFLFKVLSSGFALLQGSIKTLGDSFKSLGAVFILLFEGDFKGALEAATQGFSDFSTNAQETAGNMLTAWDGAAAGVKEVVDKKLKPALESAVQAIDKVGVATKKLIANLQMQIETFGLSAIELAKYTAEVDKASEAEIRLAANLQTTLDILTTRAELLKKAAESIAPEVATAQEEFTGFLGSIGLTFDAMKKGVFGVEEFNKVLKKTGEEMSAVEAIGVTLQQGMSNVFGAALRGAKAFGKAVKQLIIALAKMIIKLLIIKALNFFFPGSGDAFGKISGALGFQHGGRPKIGQVALVGESGPELFIPDIAGTIAPIEAPPAAVNALEGISAGKTEININVEGMITGDRLDELLEKINDRVQNNDLFLLSSEFA